MVFLRFSIFLARNLPVYIWRFYFEFIDGLPLDLVTHNYRHSLSLARHETEATACGNVLCRRAKILERTRQSPHYNIIASNAHACVWLSPRKSSNATVLVWTLAVSVREREIIRAPCFYGRLRP